MPVELVVAARRAPVGLELQFECLVIDFEAADVGQADDVGPHLR